jgi:hypothetical protein
MASRRPSLRSTALVLAGVAGVVLAHGLDYLLVLRSPAHRAAELAATGHGWWSSAVGAALGAGCLALAMATAGGASGAVFRRAARSTIRSARCDIGWVALWQVGIFAALEVVERLGAHRSPVELVHGPLFAIGVVLQVAVAVAVVVALQALERAGATVTDAVLSARRGRGPARPRAFGTAAAAGLAGGGAVAGWPGPRGPPVTVAA